jgi:hypothetical protein
VSGVRETESPVPLQERAVPGALEEGRVRQVSERSVVVNRKGTLTGSADADTRSSDDGQPDLPGGGHAVLPGGGQRDYSA